MSYKNNRSDTSWQKVSKWYKESVGLQGNYYHTHVVIPSTLRMLNMGPTSSLLDLACGQGVLERAVPKEISYLGIDASGDLVDFARSHAVGTYHRFLRLDATRPLPVKETFTHAAIVLSLQNVERWQNVITNAATLLGRNGVMVLVLNHPYFRIPRQTSWAIDEKSKMQYRRVNRYLLPFKIPINSEPSKGSRGAVTWSFHFSIQDLTRELKKNGFVIEVIEEWVSDKVSAGKAAKMENHARDEFPLFMALKILKLT